MISTVVCSKNLTPYLKNIERIHSLMKELNGELLLVLTQNDYEKYKDTYNCILQRDGGLSVARNLGALRAKGNDVLFIDDDIQIDKETVLAMEKHSKNALVVGCRVVPVFKGRFLSDEYAWLVGCTTPLTTRPIGSCMMIKRFIFDYHLFDSSFGANSLYGVGEDTEFLLRHKNYNVKFLKDKFAFSIVHPDKTKILRLITRAYYEGYSKAILKRMYGADPEARKHLIYYLIHPRKELPLLLFTGIGYFAGHLKGWLSGLSKRKN